MNSSGAVLQSTDYYPFGLAFADNNVATNRYLFNGKELENYTLGTTYLGTLDYGARHYDPRIARWTVPDPMAEKYYGLSGYVYCANNPMRYIDPDGRDWRDLIRGISDAFIDDLNPNPIAPTISSSSSASNESHYNIGQVIGHVAAGLVGAAATIDGGKNMVAGAAIAVAGSATVVLIPTGGAVAAGGALEAGYGIMTMSKAAKNIGNVGNINLGNNQKKQNGSKVNTGIGSKNTVKGDKMGSNTRANKQIDDISKKYNINRKEFGKYVEQSKMKEGKKGADNYTWKELEKMAKTYKGK